MKTIASIANKMNEKILEKINSRSLKICVVGIGYVGLPTAALFSEQGFNVVGLDLNEDIVLKVNNGGSHIKEPGLDSLIENNISAGRLSATSKISEALDDSDVVIISVQTPIDNEKRPDLRYLVNAVEQLGRLLRREMLVAICSTVPPGTTVNLIKPLLEELSGLKCESDFYLAYVPERIAPGKALKELVENTRLVGGIGEKSTKFAAELFRTICRDIKETSCTNAELSKLIENTYRDVNIAFANQVALICEHYGADAKEVIALANTHPRVNVLSPGPGAGGPCLTKDPYLLVHGLDPELQRLIFLARQINEYMPIHLVKMVDTALRSIGRRLGDSKITVLGTAYKPNVDDPRESPSKVIIETLIKQGAKVVAYDPYCKEYFGAEKTSDLFEAAKGSDCLIITTDHSEFKSIDLGQLGRLMLNRLIVDAKRIFDPAEAERKGFRYFAIGLGNNEK